MNRSTLVLKLAVAALVATAGFQPGLEATAADGRRVEIEIQAFKFSLESPVVSPGDVVVWKNMDSVPHTITAKDKSWDSGLIKSGEEWEIMITDANIGAYYCRFHPVMTASLNRAPS